MNKLKILSALTAAGLCAATSASAATITAMDSTVTRSDEVMFTIDTKGNTIDKITLDVSQGRTGSRFILSDDPLVNADLPDGVTIMTSDEVDATRRFRDGFSTLMVTFADGFNGELSFLSWVNGITANSDGTGLIRTEEAANDIFATVFFTDGTQGTSNFSALDAVGKFEAEIPPVPLPASSLLLLGGIAGLGAMRRRKKT